MSHDTTTTTRTRTATGVEIRGLTLAFGRGEARKEILRGIDLDVPAGRITGLAGESGSGKTMTGLAVCGLLPAGADLGGSIRFGERELVGLAERPMNALRGTEIAMIFQDPTASLHPMLSIQQQLTDHYRFHTGASKAAARDRAIEQLERVKVPDPAGALKKYPHQFSGGQLQRIAIAMALMCDPQVLIADEPTTALDVTVQAGIIRLLRGLCDELGIAIVLVTHDLGVMSALADTIAIMRLGEIVEVGDRHQVITAPAHEYTRALIDALPEAPEGDRGTSSVADPLRPAEPSPDLEPLPEDERLPEVELRGEAAGDPLADPLDDPFHDPLAADDALDPEIRPDGTEGAR